MLERVWRKRTLLHCWWECKLGQPLWRRVWRLLKKLEIELPYDPAIPPKFTAAQFPIARTWKQPRCPLADKWIRKVLYLYTMEYYSAIKKNTCDSVLIKWMKLDSIIHSKVSQKEKHQYSILMHTYGIYKDSNKDPIWKIANDMQI